MEESRVSDVKTRERRAKSSRFGWQMGKWADGQMDSAYRCTGEVGGAKRKIGDRC